MSSGTRLSWSSNFRRNLRLVGLTVAFTGFVMFLNPTHAAGLEWVGAPLLIAGCGVLGWIAWPSARQPTAPEASIARKLLDLFTWQGQLVRSFPIIGALLVAADLAYNFVLSNSRALLTEDFLVLFTAGAFLVYGFVPARFSRERDFALLFFMVSNAILVLPLLLARAIAGNADASVDLYSWNALAPELGAILSSLGVTNSIHPVTGYTAPGLTFTPLHMSSPVTLVITTACSGIYSFGIFASAFVAFVMTEYTRPSRRLWWFLALGFVASYVANLLRMVVIVLVGYYTDSDATSLQNLLVAHSYAGWLIFLGWLAILWGPLFKFLSIPRQGETEERLKQSSPYVEPRISTCNLCKGRLGPSIPATQCRCGAFYHLACLGMRRNCLVCNQEIGTPVATAVESV
jgi:exosortase/archaeosortase family protein